MCLPVTTFTVTAQDFALAVEVYNYKALEHAHKHRLRHRDGNKNPAADVAPFEVDDLFWFKKADSSAAVENPQLFRL